MYTQKLLILFLILFMIYMTTGMKKAKSKTKGLFVLFYVPWCGHCQRAKPAFNKLMRENKFRNIKLQALNCEENPAIAKQMNIKGFPTYYYFPDGVIGRQSAIKYDGGRSKEEMENFLKHI